MQGRPKLQGNVYRPTWGQSSQCTDKNDPSFLKYSLPPNSQWKNNNSDIRILHWLENSPAQSSFSCPQRDLAWKHALYWLSLLDGTLHSPTGVSWDYLANTQLGFRFQSQDLLLEEWKLIVSSDLSGGSLFSSAVSDLLNPLNPPFWLLYFLDLVFRCFSGLLCPFVLSFQFLVEMFLFNFYLHERNKHMV